MSLGSLRRFFTAAVASVFQAYAMSPLEGEVEGHLDAGLLSFTEIGFGSLGHGSFRPMPAFVPRSSTVGGCEGRIPFVRVC